MATSLHQDQELFFPDETLFGDRAVDVTRTRTLDLEENEVFRNICNGELTEEPSATATRHHAVCLREKSDGDLPFRLRTGTKLNDQLFVLERAEIALHEEERRSERAPLVVDATDGDIATGANPDDCHTTGILLLGDDLHDAHVWWETDQLRVKCGNRFWGICLGNGFEEHDPPLCVEYGNNKQPITFCITDLFCQHKRVPCYEITACDLDMRC